MPPYPRPFVTTKLAPIFDTLDAYESPPFLRACFFFRLPLLIVCVAARQTSLEKIVRHLFTHTCPNKIFFGLIQPIPHAFVLVGKP